jgi:hypothetical protein
MLFFHVLLFPMSCCFLMYLYFLFCWHDLQGDGNLVIYVVATGKAFWASNTANAKPGSCAMQGDGNLVLYSATNVAYWASNTAKKGVAPYKLVLQDTGVANIVDSTGANIWKSQ